MADWTVTIGGVLRTVVAESLNWDDQLNARATVSFQIISAIGGYRPVDGESVVLTDNAGAVVFGGRLVEPAEERLYNGENLTHLLYRCAAVSNDALADKAIVAATYTAQTFQAIVQDIVANSEPPLAAEGVTAVDYVEVGPTITITFNYKYANECFTELCEIAGFSWWIDADLKLHGASRSTNAAPFAMTDTAPHCTWFKVTRRRAEYRNVQYVRAGIDLTDARTESFIGDGTRRTFTLAYPVGAVPTAITVNAVSKTIGIKGLETGKDWYWNKSSTEISQDDGGTPLTDAQTLAVTYQGEVPIIVNARNESEIAARAAIEGGSGEYTHIDHDANINSGTIALEKAQALLARYGQIEDVCEWETEDSGLRGGHLMSINLSAHAIAGEYLIQSVSAHDRDDVGHTLVYTVKALSGEGVGGWVRFFQKLLASQRSFVVRDNEVLLLLRQFSDGLVCGDSVSASGAAPESRIGSALVGFSEIAA